MTALSDLLRSRKPADWSAREVARRAQALGHELSEATATAYFGGRHAKRPGLITLEAFAAVLPVTLHELEDAAGMPRSGTPWVPDMEHARLLDVDQRRVLDALLLVMTRREEQDVTVFRAKSHRKGRPQQRQTE